MELNRNSTRERNPQCPKYPKGIRDKRKASPNFFFALCSLRQDHGQTFPYASMEQLPTTRQLVGGDRV